LTEFLLPGRLRSVLRGSRRPRIVGGTMSASAPTDRADTLARRLGAQQLSGPPARGPLAVAERLLAIQAQDPRGARLAIRARTSGLTAADVDRELTERRSLLITWLNRGTLHLVRSEDYPLLHRLTTPPLQTALARRLAQEGVEPDAAARGVRVIEQAVTDEGPLGRTALR
jgi:DNA glycosylase AlkZ-like